MLFDVVEDDRRSPCRLLCGADRLILVIERRLTGDIALKFTRQIDARFCRQTVKRGSLVELIVCFFV